MALKAFLFITLGSLVAAQDDPFGGATFLCATAMTCADKAFCNINGVLSSEPVQLRPDQELMRAPLLPCLKRDKSRGVCCVDPNWQSDWPNSDLTPMGSSPTCENCKDDCAGRNRTTPTEEINADFAEYPWQGAILDKNGSHVCSCSYSLGNTCVTTIKCIEKFEKGEITVSLGKYTLANNQTVDPPKNYTVKEIYRDPTFKEKDIKRNNMAVLKLAEPVETNFHTKAICMDREHAIPVENYPEKCVITGWGANKKHEKNAWTFIDVLPFRECRKKDPTFNARATSCAKITDPKINACDFDYGSGFQCPMDTSKDRKDYFKERYWLKGVLSHISDCGQKGDQIVFFSRFDTSSWLSKAINAPLE